MSVIACLRQLTSPRRDVRIAYLGRFSRRAGPWNQFKLTTRAESRRWSGPALVVTSALPRGIGFLKQGAQAPINGAAPEPIRASTALRPAYYWTERSEAVHRKPRVRTRI